MMVVRTEDGTLYYIEVELNSRLKRLREKIEEVTDIPKTHQKVIFCHPNAFDDLTSQNLDERGETFRGCFRWLFLCKRRKKKRNKMFVKQIVHLTISHVRR